MRDQAVHMPHHIKVTSKAPILDPDNLLWSGEVNIV